ncbi:DUF4114 domain-containing protein [Spirulina sp. 06S082]|uniref:DUF4114 domain-containing protein n=1 Tax=Spirulina sp. 06S082 TaxID=3110248 RepID=UPI002B1FF9BF|nr:DUF4114 domain-containing protein [Spirulina sp. 06S082]MEA5470753.1 DUF4114 domain-containing protein [Spirulina sp. 06S082]
MNFFQRFWPPFSLEMQQDRGSTKIITIEKISPPSQDLALDLSGNSDTISDMITDNHFEVALEELDSFDRNYLLNDFDLARYCKLEMELGAIEASSYPEFTAGVFTVDGTGEVEIDFLVDSGTYLGKVTIFSLDGMDEFVLGSEKFIQEAVRRSTSNSHWGYIVRDRGKTNLLTKPLTLREGDRFGIMLISHDKVDAILANSQIESTPHPLFSLATDNSHDELHFGQITDVTGEGHTFMMEDLRLDRELEGELIFTVRGAIGQAPTMKDLDEGVGQI